MATNLSGLAFRCNALSVYHDLFSGMVPVHRTKSLSLLLRKLPFCGQLLPAREKMCSVLSQGGLHFVFSHVVVF